jgi:hypothetical protein
MYGERDAKRRRRRRQRQREGDTYTCTYIQTLKGEMEEEETEGII